MKKELEMFAKWFNENQWTNNHELKAMFCKCDYEGIVKKYLEQTVDKTRGPQPLVKTGQPEYPS